MAPPSWATDEQWNWLIDKAVGYRQAQKTSQTTPWFASMWHDWFMVYLEEDELWGKGQWQRPFTAEQTEELAAAKETRKTKLTVWYHNHGHKTSRRGGGKKMPKVKVPREKGTRALQEIEVYSKLYYDAHVRPAVKKELKRLKALWGDKKKMEHKDRLEVVRRFTQDHYDNETPEVRAKVAHEFAQEKERARALAEANKKSAVIDVDAEGTPEEYQHAIDQAPGDIRRLLNPTHHSTGCSIMVIVTGPIPENGGAIGSFAVHFGENEFGHNFAQVTPNFKEIYARPHVHFAKGLYPEHVREARALPPSVTGIVPPNTGTRARSPSGGVGSPELSPSPGPSAQEDSPDVPSEIETPLFILEERALVPGPSTRGRSRKGAQALPSLDLEMPAAPTFTPTDMPGMPGPAYRYPESMAAPMGHAYGYPQSMWPGMQPSATEWGMPSNTSYAPAPPQMLPLWQTTEQDLLAASTSNESFDMDSMPTFNPPLPSSFTQPQTSTDTSFSYDELNAPLTFPGFPGFPVAGGDDLVGGASAPPSSRDSSPLLSSRPSSPPLSSRPSSPALSEPSESMSAPSDDTPAAVGRGRKRQPDPPAEPRVVSRVGRVVNAPKRDDAGFQASKRRKR